MARPTGVGPALATYEIRIEGGMSGWPPRGDWGELGLVSIVRGRASGVRRKA
jgi:hypothetical protein